MKQISKKIWIPLTVVGGLVVLFAIIFPIIWCCVINVDLKASAEQIDESQQIRVQWDTSELVDSVTITVKHNGDLVSKEIITDFVTINSGEAVVDAYYGKMNIEVKIQKGIYTTSEKVKCDLSASVYNFAPLTATMPVTLFSLSLDEVTQQGTIPTFVWFKRSGAWDWNSLPENVYPMPVASPDEFLESGQKVIYDKTSKYIAELYSINPDSFFNLFYNDFYAYGWVDAVFGNGIPQENYKVFLLSDGTASFSYFNEHFDNENAEENYAKMAQDWKKLKTQVAEKGSYTEKSKGFVIDANDLREYAYVMAKEEANVEWWLTRINGTLAPNNADFYSQVESTQSVKVKDLNTLLTALEEDEQQALKKLYKFSDSMFEKAEEEGKKAMVILGTWTQNEYYFQDYVSAIQTYYGDEYVYYYKGHPKNPTYTEEGKLEMLESIGLIDVDSTIPAELIIFFNPDIYLSGYATTSFVSVPSPDKCCALFNMTKETAESNSGAQAYDENMDFFITKVESSDPTYGEIVSDDDCYLLEFNDTANYEIAIFDASEKSIKYYKFNSDLGSYEEVDMSMTA